MAGFNFFKPTLLLESALVCGAEEAFARQGGIWRGMRHLGWKFSAEGRWEFEAGKRLCAGAK